MREGTDQMSCSGLHCAGCGGGGAAVPVVALAAFVGIDWVAAHLAEVAAISAICGVLAVAALVMLMRWCARRETVVAATRSLWVTRDVPAPAITGRVIPQAIQQPAAPAIEQHVHYHLHVADGYEAARVFTAIPGQAGEAITEGK
jgi:hypothetical protein